ncbi:MAG TPA: hypothetical protein VM620_03895 [Hyphomicrobium sp.]|jgi:hypothetical protein|nr:hypothetical protein [Hyphomicrobium sp.]
MVKSIQYHNQDDVWIVSGIEEAVLKKARQLVQLDPDMPKGCRDGMIYYQYDGHFCICDTASGKMFWSVQTMDGSKLPPELEGQFTSRTLMHKAIDCYGSEQAKQNGAAILERKRIKREQEKLNGTRAALPPEIEEHKIIEKAFLECELANAKREQQEKEGVA